VSHYAYIAKAAAAADDYRPELWPDPWAPPDPDNMPPLPPGFPIAPVDPAHPTYTYTMTVTASQTGAGLSTFTVTAYALNQLAAPAAFFLNHIFQVRVKVDGAWATLAKPAGSAATSIKERATLYDTVNYGFTDTLTVTLGGGIFDSHTVAFYVDDVLVTPNLEGIGSCTATGIVPLFRIKGGVSIATTEDYTYSGTTYSCLNSLSDLSGHNYPLGNTGHTTDLATYSSPAVYWRTKNGGANWSWHNYYVYPTPASYNGALDRHWWIKGNISGTGVGATGRIVMRIDGSAFTFCYWSWNSTWTYIQFCGLGEDSSAQAGTGDFTIRMSHISGKYYAWVNGAAVTQASLPYSDNTWPASGCLTVRVNGGVVNMSSDCGFEGKLYGTLFVEGTLTAAQITAIEAAL